MYIGLIWCITAVATEVGFEGYAQGMLQLQWLQGTLSASGVQSSKVLKLAVATVVLRNIRDLRSRPGEIWMRMWYLSIYI